MLSFMLWSCTFNVNLALKDMNTTSPSYGSFLSLKDYEGTISAWYFGHATWGYCSGQFGLLNTMQEQLQEEEFPIYILGVNETGFEDANQQITEGRDIPWLQDTVDVLMWDRWQVTYRDVIIFDETLKQRTIFNLSRNDLNDSNIYQELYDILTTL